MPTIATKNEVATVIIIFNVESEKQQELIDTIAKFGDTVKQQLGFVSANIYKSLDGVKVANYAQWQTKEDFENFLKNPKAQEKGAKLREFNQPDSHVYEVISSESKEGIPKIEKNISITLLNSGCSQKINSKWWN